MEYQSNRDHADRFVEAVFSACASDKGAAARLRRADNPSTEYQSWDFLVGHGVDLEKPWIRKPYALVAAAIARSKESANGSAPFGRALASCYDDGNQSKPAQARLRRVLACDNNEEATQVLRSVLTLIQQKQGGNLDYARLLRQLQWFGERTKSQWAMEFYRREATSEEGAA